jgi:hypothetical protein
MRAAAESRVLRVLLGRSMMTLMLQRRVPHVVLASTARAKRHHATTVMLAKPTTTVIRPRRV